MRRQGRLHQTVAAQQSETYWDYQPEQRVMTVDGPGRVIAVSDGPFPGAEEYEIRLEGGLGGGTYTPSQITAAGPVQASVSQVDASVTHTADIDYPELGTILYDRPDPATIRHTAELGSGAGDGGDGSSGGASSPAPSSAEVASGDADQSHIGWDPGEYNNALYHDWRVASVSHDDDHPDKVYLRFGHWPEDERSENYVTGGKEEGVSVYDLDHRGDPMDPDPDMNRGHHHDEGCESGCDLDWGNSDYGNDTHDEMNGRVNRAEKGRRNDYDLPHQTAHLVKGKMVGIGHDGEPLIQNVKRVGDWIDHRHLFIPGAPKHPLARDEHDEEYEPPNTRHLPKTATLTPEDEGYDPHADDPDEWGDDGFCYVGHPGPCRYDRSKDEPHNRHTAMPSRDYPEHPQGFTSQRERTPGNQWETQLHGYVPGKHYPVATIEHTAYDDNGDVIKYHDDPHKATALKVHMLRGGGVKGAASAVMDHLYSTYPNAKINHGYRTDEGLNWWNSYDDPAPHRNVHNLHPSEWEHHFDRKDVGEDILKNEDNDPGHHTNEHNVDWAYEDDAKTREPEGHEQLHHGMSVHLPSTDHRIVHDLGLSTEERAHHLLNVIGRGNMPEFDWHTSGSSADQAAEKSRPEVKGDTFGQPHKTKVTLHGSFEGEDATRDFEYQEHDKSFDFPSDDKGSRDFHLHGITWENTGPGYNRLNHHDFKTPQPVAIAPDDSARHTPMNSGHDKAVRELNEHHERYAPKGLPPVPSHVDQGELFPEPARQKVFAHLTMGPSPEERNALKSHLLSHHGYTNDQLSMLDDPGQGDDLIMEHEMEHNADMSGDGISGDFGRGEIDDTRIDHDHKGKGGVANRFPQTTEFNFGGTPQGHYLSMLVTAAMDRDFRFHVTAAWRDVQAKAVRIRKAGGVNITHASDGYVIANVQGDHHVYETGLQRVPGRRTAVAVYSCGCKWGAYHWGADDDMSRFAGRMCSHALALQYEAQARGMFGRDVTVDDTKPRWVPSKVVVKYDIDDGKNIKARSSLMVPEQAPLLAVLALAHEDDPALGMVLAAVNDMFGDQTGMTEPTGIDPAGPTQPWNTEENPTSAGVLAGGEPSNWGRINSPTMYPRLGAALNTEEFWQRLASVFAGVETTLHDDPEPALPFTDGEEHTASMGDVDLTGGSGIGEMGDEDLSPEDPSIMTQGSAQDIVAAFQRSAGAKHLMDSGKPGDTSNSDIAGAAEAYLQKTAASATEFSLAEREALINESPGVQASNTDRLDIAGTHYAELEVQAMNEEDDYLWMA